MFQQKETAEDLEEVLVKAAHFWVSADMRGRVAKLVTLAGLANSVAEADRKVKERAVRINGEVIDETHLVVPSGTKITIRVGKHAKIVDIYFPAAGDRVVIDGKKQGLYQVVSACFGEWAIVCLLDPQGNPTAFTEPVPPGEISPA
jgi:ribosomal protein S4